MEATGLQEVGCVIVEDVRVNAGMVCCDRGELV
jgi:hypothetical protein